MPLVFAVVVILFIIVISVSINKEARNSSHRHLYSKTNARLEQRTLDAYMKRGVNFEEAFKLTQDDMIDLGFEPCIPGGAYNDTKRGLKETSVCLYDRYDSDEVIMWRELFNKDYKNKLNAAKILGKDFEAISEEEYRQQCEEYVYSHLSKTEFQHNMALKTYMLKITATPIGGYIVYPSLGTCEVIGYIYRCRETQGRYILRILSNNNIINNIDMNDKKIIHPKQ